MCAIAQNGTRVHGCGEHSLAEDGIAAGGRLKRHATAYGTGGDDTAAPDPRRGHGNHARPSVRDPLHAARTCRVPCKS